MAKRINKQIPLVILIVFFSNIAWSGEYLKGDADGNGKINIFDALIIAEYTVELITEEQIPGIEFADVDGNGKVDIHDALRIAKFDAGLIPDLAAESEVKQGIFLDSPVEGLFYISGNQSGYTDSEGKFTYEEGKSVTFKIGDIVLGEAPGKAVITPIDIVQGAADETNQAVTNILRFIQTLDDDYNPDNGIFISEEVREKASGKNVVFSEPDFPDTIQPVINVLDDDHPSLVSTIAALSHFRLTLLTIPGSVTDYKLRQFIDMRISENMVPGGVVQIITQDGYEWIKTSGFSDVENRINMSHTAKFRVGSCTKTFTAMAVLQLAQEGKLNLDDSLEYWLPGAMQTKPEYDTENITIYHLLNHTGGLANFTANPIWLEDILIHKEVKMTPQELVDLAAAEPLFSPGEAWDYSNTGYILMGMIIEKVTGNKWEDEIRDRFIEPLGLTHTDIPETGELGIPGEFVHGYIDLYAESDGQFGTPGVIIDNTEMEPSLLWSAGVIVSNFNDMARWMKAVGEGQLLNETYQNILETEYIIIDQNSGFGWGLGFMKIGILDIIGHTGQLLGYDTSVNYQTSSRYSIAGGINRELCSDEPYTDVNYMILYDVMAFLNGLADIPSAQSKF
ncbi:MAG: serine hydrolase [Desulfobacterales bacterium]|nr:serine hydrolase [Desulfobacterales bacterium]